jgi:hypothetical protein
MASSYKATGTRAPASRRAERRDDAHTGWKVKRRHAFDVLRDTILAHALPDVLSARLPDLWGDCDDDGEDASSANAADVTQDNPAGMQHGEPVEMLVEEPANMQVGAPGMQVGAPGMQVGAPGMQEETPEMQVETPEMQVETLEMQMRASGTLALQYGTGGMHLPTASRHRKHAFDEVNTRPAKQICRRIPNCMDNMSRILLRSADQVTTHLSPDFLAHLSSILTDVWVSLKRQCDQGTPEKFKCMLDAAVLEYELHLKAVDILEAYLPVPLTTGDERHLEVCNHALRILLNMCKRETPRVFYEDFGQLASTKRSILFRACEVPTVSRLGMQVMTCVMDELLMTNPTNGQVHPSTLGTSLTQASFDAIQQTAGSVVFPVDFDEFPYDDIFLYESSPPGTEACIWLHRLHKIVYEHINMLGSGEAHLHSGLETVCSVLAFLSTCRKKMFCSRRSWAPGQPDLTQLLQNSANTLLVTLCMQMTTITYIRHESVVRSINPVVTDAIFQLIVECSETISRLEDIMSMLSYVFVFLFGPSFRPEKHIHPCVAGAEAVGAMAALAALCMQSRTWLLEQGNQDEFPYDISCIVGRPQRLPVHLALGSWHFLPRMASALARCVHLSADPGTDAYMAEVLNVCTRICGMHNPISVSFLCSYNVLEDLRMALSYRHALSVPLADAVVNFVYAAVSDTIPTDFSSYDMTRSMWSRGHPGRPSCEPMSDTMDLALRACALEEHHAGPPCQAAPMALRTLFERLDLPRVLELCVACYIIFIAEHTVEAMSSILFICQTVRREMGIFICQSEIFERYIAMMDVRSTGNRTIQANVAHFELLRKECDYRSDVLGYDDNGDLMGYDSDGMCP